MSGVGVASRILAWQNLHAGTKSSAPVSVTVGQNTAQQSVREALPRALRGATDAPRGCHHTAVLSSPPASGHTHGL
eukprot:15448166-Alexandrium_andersonii.AAC.1